MAPFLALILLPPAWAATPPIYEPAAGIRALRASADAALQAVSGILSTPVEKERAPALKGLIDELVRNTEAAAAAARSLYSAGQAPADTMEAAVKGKGSVESVDHLYDGAAESVSALRARCKAAFTLARALENPREKPLPPEKKQDLKEAFERLTEADRTLKEAEERLKELDDSRWSVRQNAGRGRDARYELEKAADDLDKTASSLRDAGAEAKARIDDLGTEPQNETRGRAYQKLAPVQDGGRAVNYAADVAKNRAESFRDRYAAFLKASKGFEETRKAIAQLVEESGKLVSSTEDALSRLKD